MDSRKSVEDRQDIDFSLTEDEDTYFATPSRPSSYYDAETTLGLSDPLVALSDSDQPGDQEADSTFVVGMANSIDDVMFRNRRFLPSLELDEISECPMPLDLSPIRPQASSSNTMDITLDKTFETSEGELVSGNPGLTSTPNSLPGLPNNGAPGRSSSSARLQPSKIPVRVKISPTTISANPTRRAQ